MGFVNRLSRTLFVARIYPSPVIVMDITTMPKSTEELLSDFRNSLAASGLAGAVKSNEETFRRRFARFGR